MQSNTFYPTQTMKRASEFHAIPGRIRLPGKVRAGPSAGAVLALALLCAGWFYIKAAPMRGAFAADVRDGAGELRVIVVDQASTAGVEQARVEILDGSGGTAVAADAGGGAYFFTGIAPGIYPTLVVRKAGYVTDITRSVKVLPADRQAFATVLLVRSSSAERLPWLNERRMESLAAQRAARRSQMEAMGYEFDDEGNVLKTPEDRKRDLDSWETGRVAENADGPMTLTVRGRKVSSTVESALRLRSDMHAASDITTEKEIKKTGDSTAGDAMRRVVGVSVVGGKYVYVRGLGERYSLTLFNNAFLPTPEPDRRVVPLDLFPTAMIDRITVAKTYTPDLPGDFAGGTVQISAKSIPAGRTFSAGVSLSADDGTTGRKVDTYAGGKLDWLGYDTGNRRMPSRVPDNEKVVAGSIIGGMSQETLKNIGAGFNNTWRVSGMTAPPGTGLSVTCSEKAGKFGVFANALWKGAWELDEYRRVTWKNEGSTDNPKLALKNDYDFRESSYKAMFSALALVGWQPDGSNEVNARVFHVHTGTDRVRVYKGFYNDTQADIWTSNIEWTERSLTHIQVSGSHRGPSPVFDPAVARTDDKKRDISEREAKLDWRVTLSLSSSDSPERKQVRYDWEELTGAWVWSDRPGTNERSFSTLSEWMAEGGLDWLVPFTAAGGRHSFKAGAMVLRRDRHFRSRTFQYKPVGTPMTSVDGSAIDFHDTDPEALFNLDTIWPGGFEVNETTRATDEYESAHDVVAGYIMGVFNLTPDLMLNAGFRIEYSEQSIATYDPFSAAKSRKETSSENIDILPGINLRWRLARGLQSRVSFSRTVNRPEFRELAEFEFSDVVGEYPVKGNSELKRAVVSNIDLRLEAFPNAGEVLALSLFYKHFENPIERILQPTTEFRISFANAKSAQNFGVELEFRLGLSHLHESLARLEFVFNASLIESSVDLSGLAGMQTSKNRALQGQSPFLLNAALSWVSQDGDGPLDGLTASVAFNTAGRRISNVGAAGLPDMYEETSFDLKLVLSKKIPHGGLVSVEFGNLLLHYPKYTQGGKIVQEGRGSIEVKLGFTWSF